MGPILMGSGFQLAASAIAAVATAKNKQTSNPKGVAIGTMLSSQLLINTRYGFASPLAKISATVTSLFFCSFAGQMVKETENSQTQRPFKAILIATFSSLIGFIVITKVTLVAGPILGLVAGQLISDTIGHLLT